MATKKEVTVEEKLRRLYQLQEIDSNIDEIEVLKGELPMEVKDLEDVVVGLETRLSKLENTVNEYRAEYNKHLTNIQESEALILRYNSQLEEVKNNREYESLMKEIELQKLEIQLSEKKSRVSKSMISDKETLLEAGKANIEKKEKELAEKRIELERIIQETDKEENKLRNDSEKARAHVEERLMRSYNKIRGAYRNGLAVVTVERNSCGGCFNRIPPQTQLEIAQRKKIIVCEHCGRVLVDENIMSESTLEDS